MEANRDHPWGPIQKAIELFVAARERLGHAIAVYHWDSHGWNCQCKKLAEFVRALHINVGLI